MRKVFALVWIAAVVVGCNDTTLLPFAKDSDPPDWTAPDDKPIACNFYSVDSDGELWRIDPDAVAAIHVGSTNAGVSFTDVTITPDEQILAITRWDVYRIDPSNAATTLIKDDLFGGQPVAADTMVDGRLLVGGDGEFAVVDMNAETYDVIGNLPASYEFSGDIAVDSATSAYATARTGPGEQDHLFQIDMVTGLTTDLGSLGAERVFGLDYGCDGRLYGVIANLPPEFLLIDSSTGQSQLLGTPVGPATLWGAAGPADGF